jgi:glutamine synthetase
MKQLCARRGVQVTFMAKWNADLPGCGGHLHQSIWGTDVSNPTEKRNLFHDARAKSRVSDIARNYIAGQIALMPALTALYSPTINSYKRYVPGLWAPLTASWGIENRTTTIRAIPGGPSSTRLEYRQTASDMNPYIAIAACLAAGLYGIENVLVAPPPSEGDAQGLDGKLTALPRTLKEANALLAASAEARALLGPEFVDHYVRTRDWEVRQFEKAVTEWELKRYFESV